MKDRYILSLDQGTTSSRSLLFDHQGRVVATAQQPFQQYFPRAGWVEHDPIEIWQSQLSTLTQVIKEADIEADQIVALGITNQRETTVVWEADTGKPIHNAIVWQCRRTANLCQQLKSRGLEQHVRQTTGLVIDPYFSATKIAWILDSVPGARQRAERGELRFGTIDSWLIWNLTSGQKHVTDHTNASRTMLYDIHRQCWDATLLEALAIPSIMLPEVKASQAQFGSANIDGIDVPIAGVAGDQQSALFGQGCFKPGQGKNTYGTGCFLLMHTGEQQVVSRHGLLTTLVCNEPGRVEYALEGSVFMGGASVQWLRDQLGLIESAAESEAAANSVDNTSGVYLVPAFTGLGAPYWDADARGVLVGLTRGANRNHIIRATLEAIAYQCLDVLDAMTKDADVDLVELRVDGGAVENNFLMQFQADVLNTDVVRPSNWEVTALGAAFLAGLTIGFWPSREQLPIGSGDEQRFSPNMKPHHRAELLRGWQQALAKCRSN